MPQVQMNKSDLITKIAGEAEGSPLLQQLYETIEGGDREVAEKLLPLKAVAEELSLHPTWLSKLQVHTNCGHRLAGRRRYTLSEVKSYLQSPACDRRMEELRLKRKKGGR